MPKVLTEKSNYEDIADAIRAKAGTGEKYLPSEMPAAIMAIQGDVTGVKGDAENSYRTGNVNLTPANIGAKATQTPVASPSASGTAVEFIDSVAQNAEGVISPTKKTVRTATTSQSGLMSAADKGKLDTAVTDITALKARTSAVEANMERLAVYPSEEKTGAMVTVAGTVDAPPAGLTIYGRSLQEGATPSPSAPVSIVTAGSGGTLSMVSAAKNLIRRFVNTIGTGTGCSWTYDAETGTYTLTSTVGSGSGKVVYGGEIGVRNAAGQTLTLSAESITGDSNASVRIHQGDNQLAMIYGSTLSTTFRVPNEEPLTMTLRMGNATASGVTAILKGVQLEVGSARTDFAPMLDKLTAAIPTPNGLPGVQVASGGNYTDTGETQWICDTIDLEAGTWTKRCGVVTLDGSVPSDWRKESTTSGNYRFAYPKLIDVIQRTNNDSYAPLLCSHYPVVTANGTWSMGNRNGIAVADNGGIYVTDADLNTSGSTVADLMAKLSAHPMTIVYVLAAPEVVQLTTAQLEALRSLRGRKGQTNLYSADPAGPEIRAEMYIDLMTYIQSVVDAQNDAPARLTSLEITPAAWDNIHPDFNSATEEYAVTMRKGNAATVNAVVIGTGVSVEFSNIGGAVTYFTTSTSSSAVGSRKTYSCNVSPFNTGVGGGLVIAVTEGNVTRRYYLNITSVE